MGRIIPVLVRGKDYRKEQVALHGENGAGNAGIRGIPGEKSERALIVQRGYIVKKEPMRKRNRGGKTLTQPNVLLSIVLAGAKNLIGKHMKGAMAGGCG